MSDLSVDDGETVEEFVRSNHDRIVRVLRHSSNETARAYAWALLDATYDGPELEQLHDELSRLTDGEGVTA